MGCARYIGFIKFRLKFNVNFFLEFFDDKKFSSIKMQASGFFFCGIVIVKLLLMNRFFAD